MGTKTKAKTAAVIDETAASCAADTDPNAKHRIAKFEVIDGVAKTRYSVYLLNPGEVYAGFGGSSAGLPVRKTASLFVRTVSPWGAEDREYNLADPFAWMRIFVLYDKRVRPEVK